MSSRPPLSQQPGTRRRARCRAPRLVGLADGPRRVRAHVAEARRRRSLRCRRRCSPGPGRLGGGAPEGGEAGLRAVDHFIEELSNGAVLVGGRETKFKPLYDSLRTQLHSVARDSKGGGAAARDIYHILSIAFSLMEQERLAFSEHVKLLEDTIAPPRRGPRAAPAADERGRAQRERAVGRDAHAAARAPRVRDGASRKRWRTGAARCATCATAPSRLS